MVPRASVLIPVKNGGALLGEVLDAVLAQSTPWPFEVVVVDSGSRDGSVECARQRGVRVELIPAAEFGHGRTRNYLASLSRGDFLVFITQDARPADAHWLRHLVEGCDSAPDVAGAFGPHRAHPGARHVTERELAEHFAGFGSVLSRVQLEDRERFDREVGYRQWLHFFSNNNSCLRRSVWEKLPFPDVMFAEDQTWMLSAIKAGYAKAFVPEAAVYHSHDFGVWETLQRNFDEASSFQRDFGYDMQRSLARALASAVLLARRDARWLRQAGVRGWSWLKHSAYMAGIELARTSGQFLGTRHQSLPAWLLRVISRDQALQRGRAA
ncbi:glycosyltransferase family 2 protein [Alicycliphilus denitrificans]|uniref:Glycosyltransferase family 2 protein n=2 Tax=Alicycliphilus denitrificans TaxID=179636 RepID=A0A3R7H5C8_9BURK|nr:glycosyltransferase family 2 protein [Alicycliphilus denitrificans]RKJ99822.1 glycosyltransferase family 2 protein [Alicycliphilus denitrificans]